MDSRCASWATRSARRTPPTTAWLAHACVPTRAHTRTPQAVRSTGERARDTVAHADLIWQASEREIPWLYRYVRASMRFWMRQAKLQRSDPSVYVDIDGANSEISRARQHCCVWHECSSSRHHCRFLPFLRHVALLLPCPRRLSATLATARVTMLACHHAFVAQGSPRSSTVCAAAA